MNNFYNKLRYQLFNRDILYTIPDEPGVYLFFDNKLKNLYIGKAKSLKKRLRSYFNINLYSKTDNLIKKTRYLSYIRVFSELEAIFLEAKLINKYKPYYNIALKDDKSPLYIFITDDKYPRLIYSRKNAYKGKYIEMFGPFLNAKKVKSALSSIRKVIPYSTHQPTDNKCIYSQMGLCNPCPSEIENIDNLNSKRIMYKTYMSNIKNLKLFLSGKFHILDNLYKKSMRNYSKIENFEMAQIYKNKLEQLSELTTPNITAELYTDDPYLKSKRISEELLTLNNIIEKEGIRTGVSRIECYDISHLHGTGAAGSMVTFLNGYKDKKYYRHFRLHKSQNNDLRSLEEIGERRIHHFIDWGIPNIIIVDGGKGQVNVFQKIYKPYNIPVLGIAKRYEKLIIPNNKGGFNEIRLSGGALNIISRIRNEAHRFALNYHHKIIEKIIN